MATEKTGLSYSVAKGPNPKHEGQYTYRPLLKILATKNLDQIVEAAFKSGKIDQSAYVAKACVLGVLAQVVEFCEQGMTCKLDNYATFKPRLTGTVDGHGGQITSANGMKISVTAGPALKLAIGDYSFTNVDAGKAARITAVQTAAGSYPKGVIAAGDIDILGSNLAFAAGDKIEFWAVNDAGVRTSSSAKWTITAANQVKTNTDKLLEVTLNNELDPSGKYEVVVTHVKTVDGKTIETSSNAFKVAVDAGQGGA